jgi:hypothetical protein
MRRFPQPPATSQAPELGPLVIPSSGSEGPPLHRGNPAKPGDDGI